MKKTLILLAVVASTTAMAQVKQGALFVTGGIGFSSTTGSTESGGTSVDAPKVSSFNFTPSVGYFLTDNIAGGLMLNVNSTKTDDEANKSESKGSSFGVGVFGRYYGAINEKLYLYGQLDLGITSGKSETKSGGVTVDGPKTNSFGVNVRPGFTFFPSSRWGLDFNVGLLGLNSHKSTSKSNAPGGSDTVTKTSDFDFGVNMSAVTIGVQLFFGGTGAAGE